MIHLAGGPGDAGSAVSGNDAVIGEHAVSNFLAIGPMSIRAGDDIVRFACVCVAVALLGRLTVPDLTVFTSAASPLVGASHVATVSAAPSTAAAPRAAANLPIFRAEPRMASHR